ncbi:transposase [Saccharothrix ecbatanensis]|uniref:Transposase n=1 Tax=Saccharothrix ecbatanensis TaxID=1105145 RepID=A0A7W9HR99_9PSEU|nr:transposase [Saccharothrix ecbatanensis]MBB5806588.1 transposase [Saccharothrix ecbatanensis]
MWFLIATIDVPEPELSEPAGWLGVDLGIVNITTTADEVRAAGRRLNRHRAGMRALRRKLQAKRTTSARRALKRLRRREARFATDVNHVLSKQLVTTAQRTGRGNRPHQAVFACRRCGHTANADHNASRDIGHAAEVAWNAEKLTTAMRGRHARAVRGCPVDKVRACGQLRHALTSPADLRDPGNSLIRLREPRPK